MSTIRLREHRVTRGVANGEAPQESVLIAQPHGDIAVTLAKVHLGGPEAHLVLRNEESGANDRYVASGEEMIIGRGTTRVKLIVTAVMPEIEQVTIKQVEKDHPPKTVHLYAAGCSPDELPERQIDAGDDTNPVYVRVEQIGREGVQLRIFMFRTTQVSHSVTAHYDRHNIHSSPFCYINTYLPWNTCFRVNRPGSTVEFAPTGSGERSVDFHVKTNTEDYHQTIARW